MSSENMENPEIFSQEMKPTTEDKEVSESREISLEENAPIDESSESNSNGEEQVATPNFSKVNASNSLNSPVDEKATEATEEIGDDYGCEHYKRKSKFVVSP